MRSVTCHHWFLPAAIFFNLPERERGREGGREEAMCGSDSTVQAGWKTEQMEANYNITKIINSNNIFV